MIVVILVNSIMMIKVLNSLIIIITFYIILVRECVYSNAQYNVAAKLHDFLISPVGLQRDHVVRVRVGFILVDLHGEQVVL